MIVDMKVKANLIRVFAPGVFLHLSVIDQGVCGNLAQGRQKDGNQPRGVGRIKEG